MKLYFKLEVGDFMFEKFRDFFRFNRAQIIQSDGFILLESLVSLSIVTFVVVAILPFSVSLIKARENRQVMIEGYRLLYDASMNNSHSTLVKVQNGVKYKAVKSSGNIIVTIPNHDQLILRIE